MNRMIAVFIMLTTLITSCAANETQKTDEINLPTQFKLHENIAYKVTATITADSANIFVFQSVNTSHAHRVVLFQRTGGELKLLNKAVLETEVKSLQFSAKDQPLVARIIFHVLYPKYVIYMDINSLPKWCENTLPLLDVEKKEEAIIGYDIAKPIVSLKFTSSKEGSDWIVKSFNCD